MLIFAKELLPPAVRPLGEEVFVQGLPKILIVARKKKQQNQLWKEQWQNKSEELHQSKIATLKKTSRQKKKLPRIRSGFYSQEKTVT